MRVHVLNLEKFMISCDNQLLFSYKTMYKLIRKKQNIVSSKAENSSFIFH